MVMIFAHRGASGVEPENSKRAFLKAIDYMADYIELDVQRCKSNELIIFHDYTTNRITNNRYKKNICEMELSELKNIDIGFGERIMTLDEVIDITKGNIKLNIELKSKNNDDNLVDSVLYTLEKKEISDQVLVSSFNHYLIEKIKEKEPNIKTGALFVEELSLPHIFKRLYFVDDFIKKAKRAKADFINLPSYFINEKMINSARNNGLGIISWTSKKSEDKDKKNSYLQKMAGFDIDGIITNYPNKVKR